MALTDSILAYYKFEGNANASVGTNGTASNVTFNTTNGKIGQGGGYNGTSSNINIPEYNVGSYATLTVSVWFKLGTASQNTAIVGGFADGFWDVYGRGIKYNTNTLTVMGEANNDKSALTYGLTDTSSFHHAVAIFSATGALWVDGVSRATGDISSGYTYDWFIGKDQSTSRFFNGAIDELGIWSRALTNAEIAELYNNGSGLTYPFSTNFFTMF